LPAAATSNSENRTTFASIAFNRKKLGLVWGVFGVEFGSFLLVFARFFSFFVRFWCVLGLFFLRFFG
jgi:hypothetical protein